MLTHIPLDLMPTAAGNEAQGESARETTGDGYTLGGEGILQHRAPAMGSWAYLQPCVSQAGKWRSSCCEGLLI